MKDTFSVVCCCPQGRKVKEGEILSPIVKMKNIQTLVTPYNTEPNKRMHIQTLVLNRANVCSDDNIG